MTVSVVETFHETIKPMWGKKKSFVRKKKTPQKKITQLKNAVRLRVCLVMCSSEVSMQLQLCNAFLVCLHVLKHIKIKS